MALGLVVYSIACAAGVGARVGAWHLGRAHHVLYAVVLVVTAIDVVVAFHAALLVTLAALLVLPRTRPRELGHPLLAAVGLVAYILARGA